MRIHYNRQNAKDMLRREPLAPNCWGTAYFLWSTAITFNNVLLLLYEWYPISTIERVNAQSHGNTLMILSDFSRLHLAHKIRTFCTDKLLPPLE